MSIKQISGEPLVISYKAPASTAFDYEDAVTMNSSGLLAKATKATPRSELLGLIQRTIASTDADYASAKVVGVLKFHDNAEFEATVDSGTPATTNIGERFDLNDEDGISVVSQSQKCFEVTKYINATTLRGKFITDGDKRELKTIEQLISVADFTDGGSTAGTLVLNDAIPIGAIVKQAYIKNVVGFAGDTSAVVTIGDGSDVDRYNTGTPNVFATATNISAGAVSGTAYHASAVSATVTVTTATDFGLTVTDNNGAMRVVIEYFEA